MPEREPDVPVVSGVDGEPRTTGAGVRSALVDGILSPVRWVDVQRTLVERGIDLAFEVGPGGVLAGLARRTAKELRVLPVATPDDVDAAVAAAEEQRADVPS